MIRLFVDAPLQGGSAAALTPDQTRYLVAVMRRSVGDDVLLFNGRDGEWTARLAEVGKRGALLAVEARTRAQTAGPDLELVVALVKRSRLETIVEKAAELGVRRVRPVIPRRTNADHTRADRLRAIAVEASEQCGRLDVPEIAAPERLERLLDGWDEGRRLMVCDEGEGFDEGRAERVAPPPALNALREADAGPWAVLIGPEGGWAPEERARLAGLPFVTRVSLGPRILRADTAAISALTLWQAALGDWRAAAGSSTYATHGEADGAA